MSNRTQFERRFPGLLEAALDATVIADENGTTAMVKHLGMALVAS